MWITDIWTRPLASWTLLDLIGVVILAPIALSIVGLLLMVPVVLVVAGVERLKTFKWYEWLILVIAVAFAIILALVNLGVLADKPN